MLTAAEYSDQHGRLLPEPSQIEQAAAPRVLTILSAVLEKLVARNDRLADGLTVTPQLSGKSLNAFHGVRAPSISIPKYLERIYKLLVTCVMVASKMMDDVHYNNAFYARVGGVSNAELNKLELELLFLLDFGVTVSSRVFESYCSHLEKEMLVNGNGTDQKIERGLMSNSIDDVTEISVEITEDTCSPPSTTGVTGLI
ncbi:hypothetical protein QYF36_011069 [Acer negundo]|nr:hypothetical protein QYF36_011069 [Acer negundo]